MPLTVASTIGLALFQAGASVAFVNSAIAVTSTLVTVGLSVGASYAAQLLAPKPEAPKPSDISTNIAQPIPFRVVHYGIRRAGGFIVWIEERDGQLYKAVVTSTRRMNSVIGYYVDDELVTVDGSGRVNEFKSRGGVSKDDRLVIKTRLGQVPETAYAELISAFPDNWTADHRGDGCASLLAILDNPGIQNIGKVFPRGVGTEFSLVCETSILWDPRLGTYDNPAAHVFSENAALVVLDYLISPWGMRLDRSWIENAIEEWIAAANVCDQDAALKAGGTEKRWRCATTYTTQERPADVLQRMLNVCNGQIFPTANMGIALKVGQWEEPTITLGIEDMQGYQGLVRGSDPLKPCNTVRATYTSRDHDYQEADADPWVDDAAVSIDGEEAQSFEFLASPSHSQTRRLMKIAYHQLNPRHRGTLVLTLGGIAKCLGQRFVRVNLPDVGLDNETVEIEGAPQFLTAEGSVVTGGQIEIRSMSSEAYEWDALSEEGNAPPVPGEVVQQERVLPVPTGFALAKVTRTINGQSFAFAAFSADAPAQVDDSLAFEISSDGGATWSDVSHDPQIDSAEYGPLSDDVEYLGRARTQSLTGRKGAATATQAISNAYTPDLAANGAFSSDADWSKGAGWTISGGIATKAPGAASDLTQVSGALAAGETYRVIFSLGSYAAGGVRPILTGTSLALGTLRTAPGTYTEDIVAPAGVSGFGLSADATADLTVDNFSIRLVA